MVVASSGNELIGCDLSSIESRVLALVVGEQWKLDAYYKYDETGDPRLEPYCETACKIFGVPSGTYPKLRPSARSARQAIWSFGYMGGVRAWKKFKPEGNTDTEIERFRDEWRDAHPMTVRFWYAIDRAAVQAVYEPNVAVACGLIALKSDGEFLKIRLPSGRELCYPNPRLIVDDRDTAKVVYDENSKGRFARCRGGFGAYGG
jgi:DNA polymerase